MDQMAPGIHRVGSGYVHAYVVDGDEGVVLVDTGLPRRHGEVEAALGEIGRAPSDVVAILLTHAHADHTGGAAALRDATGAVVVASAIDAPAVRGDAPVPPPPILQGLPSFLTRLVPRATPVDVDHEVAEGRTAGLPGDFDVVDSPGHTPGHVSYLLDRGHGALFVGDAAVAKDGGIAKGFMNRATSEWRSSIAHIAERDFEDAFFGHSGPVMGGAAAAFARLAASS